MNTLIRMWLRIERSAPPLHSLPGGRPNDNRHTHITPTDPPTNPLRSQHTDTTGTTILSRTRPSPVKHEDLPAERLIDGFVRRFVEGQVPQEDEEDGLDLCHCESESSDPTDQFGPLVWTPDAKLTCRRANRHQKS